MLKIIKDVYKMRDGKKRYARIALEEGDAENEDYKIFPIKFSQAVNAVNITEVRNMLDNTNVEFILEKIEEVLNRQEKEVEHKSEILNQLKENKKEKVIESIEITIRIPKVR